MRASRIGKTRAGAEWVRQYARHNPEARIALVGASLAEARGVMVEGESGLLAIAPPDKVPQYEPSLRRLTWPNGAQAFLFSAAEPESLRGLQHHAALVRQAQKDLFVNAAFALADRLLHPAITAELADPPTTPAAGETWLIASNATGAWLGHDGELASFQNGSWTFSAPGNGMRLLDLSTGQAILYFNGWQRPASPAQPTGGTTVDAEARTAIGALISALQSAGVFATA